MEVQHIMIIMLRTDYVLHHWYTTVRLMSILNDVDVGFLAKVNDSTFIDWHSPFGIVLALLEKEVDHTQFNTLMFGTEKNEFLNKLNAIPIFICSIFSPSR